jgi:GTP-binding protein HflX
MVEVLNKIDRIEPETHAALLEQARRHHPVVAISAVTGEGCDRLIETVEAKLGSRLLTLTYHLGHDQGAAIAWLYQHGEMIERCDEAEHSTLTVRLAPGEAERFEQRFGAMAQQPQEQARRSHG